jgi:hypothetical protein
MDLGRFIAIAKGLFCPLTPDPLPPLGEIKGNDFRHMNEFAKSRAVIVPIPGL